MNAAPTQTTPRTPVGAPEDAMLVGASKARSTAASAAPTLPGSSIGIVLLAAALLGACGSAPTGSPEFIDLRRIDPVHGDAAAGKTAATVCSACHGADGVSPIPAFPSLAGQHAEYIYWRLIAFQREARADSPMTAIVAPLDDQALRDLASFYASLAPPPARASTDPAAAERGAGHFRIGDLARGVPPCQGCHGAHGEGHPRADEAPRYRVFPALRGQHAAYLVQRLHAFRDGGGGISSGVRIMRGVAHDLDDASIADLAAWLETQSVPPATMTPEEE